MFLESHVLATVGKGCVFGVATVSVTPFFLHIGKISRTRAARAGLVCYSADAGWRSLLNDELGCCIVSIAILPNKLQNDPESPAALYFLNAVSPSNG